MIISLVTVLVLLLTGGPGEIFLVPKVDKKIKVVVEEKEREKEVLVLFKDTKKEIKSSNKELEKQAKQLKKDKFRDPLSLEEVEELLMELNDKKKQNQAFMVQQRLKVRELMTKQEWDKLIELSLESLELSEKKQLKQLEKQNKEMVKLLSSTRVSFNKTIDQPDNLVKAHQDYNSFEGAIIQLLNQVNQYNLENKACLQDYDATQNELLNVYQSKNETREQMYKEFLNLRDTMLEYITLEEWKTITKSFVQLV